MKILIVIAGILFILVPILVLIRLKRGNPMFALLGGLGAIAIMLNVVLY